jgi:polar amino acid transport system substrate-binding protein
LAGVASLWLAPTARADRLDEIKQRGELVWGGDESGGAPYVFKKEEDGKYYGFEVDIADEIAKELGVKARFQQGEWVQLPAMLDKGDIDLALNGIELTQDRQENYLCTRPYYVYGLQLLVRQDSSIQKWEDLDDLKAKGKLTFGVLEGTAAEEYLKKRYGADLVKSFDNAKLAMKELEEGTISATLQDDCFAIYFADDYPKIRFVGRPIAPGLYVGMVKKTEPRLLAAINQALDKMIQDGRLKKIYDHWDMAGRAQVVSLRNAAEIKLAASGSDIQKILLNSFPFLLKAAGMTVFLAVASMPLAILIGILIAIGRMYGAWFVAKPLSVYVEVVRGTPLMLQLYFIYYLLPSVGISLPPLVAGVLGLAINYSAYEAEIYRAGFQAVPSGQMEAALSLGMTRRQSIFGIVLPQAFRIVIPPVANDFIALFKDTSVCSVITIVELTKQYEIQFQNHPGALVQLAVVTGILYMLMSYPLSRFSRWSERKLAGKKFTGAHGQVAPV